MTKGTPGRGGRPAPPRKPRKPRAKRLPQITAEEYNRLWAGYTIKQTVDFAARHAGLAPRLAAFFVDGLGRPDLGMHPIRERWARVMAATQEEQALTVTEWHRRNLQAVQVAMATVGTEIALLAEDAKQRLATYQAGGGASAPELRESLSKVAETADRLIRLGERMLGGPDAKVQVSGGMSADLAQLTVEELVEFSTTGMLPAGRR